MNSMRILPERSICTRLQLILEKSFNLFANCSSVSGLHVFGMMIVEAWIARNVSKKEKSKSKKEEEEKKEDLTDFFKTLNSVFFFHKLISSMCQSYCSVTRELYAPMDDTKSINKSREKCLYKNSAAKKKYDDLNVSKNVCLHKRRSIGHWMLPKAHRTSE